MIQICICHILNMARRDTLALAFAVSKNVNKMDDRSDGCETNLQTRSPHLTVFLKWWDASAPLCFVPEELALPLELLAPSALLWLLGGPALLTTRWLTESPWRNQSLFGLPGSPPIPVCASLLHLSNKWWRLSLALSKFAMHYRRKFK